MADLLSHAHLRKETEDPRDIKRNTRNGLWMFSFYLAFYVAFVFMNAFMPMWMEWSPLGGVNLSILFGGGLILTAIAFALIYAWLCRQIRSRPEVKP